MKKIIIVNTHEIYGGTIALSVLCKLLREMGVDAKTFYLHYFPVKDENLYYYWKSWLAWSIKYHYDKFIYRFIKRTKFADNKKYETFKYTPVRGVKEKLTPFFSRKNTVILYPESIFGNPLQATNVVRWLLFHYQFKHLKPFSYQDNDLFISYRDIFNDIELNPQQYNVKINYFDKEMYKQYNFKERNGNCYIIRKGYKRTDLPKSFDGPVIDYGMTESEIVDIFNNCKYCYSYDTQTFYTTIAAICGCIPIIVMEQGKSKLDYRGKNYKKSYGKAYGDSAEQIEWAIKTRELLMEELDYTQSNMENAKRFIEIIEKRFGK